MNPLTKTEADRKADIRAEAKLAFTRFADNNLENDRWEEMMEGVRERLAMKFTFYGTFGHGQVGFPGYLEIVVEADDANTAAMLARQRMREATDNKWCGLYDSLDKMHDGDKVFRGQA